MVKTLIRRAAAEDFAELLDIDTGSFPEGIAYDSMELSYFMNRKGAETFVLETEGTIAAFLIVEIRRSGKSATIVTLDVRSEFRRLGFASQLVEESEAFLAERGVGAYELQVDVGNAAAIAFYEKWGFRTTRTIRGYYSNGNDAYLMVKTLPPSVGA